MRQRALFAIAARTACLFVVPSVAMPEIVSAPVWRFDGSTGGKTFNLPGSAELTFHAWLRMEPAEGMLRARQQIVVAPSFALSVSGAEGGKEAMLSLAVGGREYPVRRLRLFSWVQITLTSSPSGMRMFLNRAELELPTIPPVAYHGAGIAHVGCNATGGDRFAGTIAKVYFDQKARDRDKMIDLISLTSPMGFSARPKRQCADQLPVVDLTPDLSRLTVVAQGTDSLYQGHPTTIIAPDGKTLFCVWTTSHGGPCGPMARSDDSGRTWRRIDDILPKEYAACRNCPTFQRLDTSDGVRKRMFVFSSHGGNPLGRMYSEDNGATWHTLPAVDYLCSEMPPTGLVRLADGRSALFGQQPKPDGVRGQDVWMSVTSDGGMTWGRPRVVASAKNKDLCEPFAIRSPDGRSIALIMREDFHAANSMAAFSSDEGSTWTEPVDTCWGLTGDRHEGVMLPDGRYVIAFRDRAQNSSTFGQYVAWVGTWDDLRNARPGQYRIHLIRSYAGTTFGGMPGDTGYSGVELLPDGTILATTYVVYAPDGHYQSVVSTRFSIEETDVLAK